MREEKQDGLTEQMDGFLRAPGDGGGRRVGVGHAEERGIRAANVPVVVVSLYGHRWGVWKWERERQLIQNTIFAM